MNTHAPETAPTPRRVALASAVGATISLVCARLLPETVGRSLDETAPVEVRGREVVAA